MRRFLAIALSASCLAASSALADTSRMACEGESFMIPGWGGGTMNVTYDGARNGTLTVKGPHTDFSVPATFKTHEKPYPPVIINGEGDIETVMPDLKAVDACAASQTKPDSGPDDYSFYAMNCLEKAPASTAPVPVHATATITYLSNDTTGALEPSVEMKLTYLDKPPSRADNLTLELMPKDCKSIP